MAREQWRRAVSWCCPPAAVWREWSLDRQRHSSSMGFPGRYHSAAGIYAYDGILSWAPAGQYCAGIYAAWVDGIGSGWNLPANRYQCRQLLYHSLPRPQRSAPLPAKQLVKWIMRERLCWNANEPQNWFRYNKTAHWAFGSAGSCDYTCWFAHPANVTKNNWTPLVWQCNMYGRSRLKISSERLPEKIFDKIICSLINENILLKRLDSDWKNWCNNELQ